MNKLRGGLSKRVKVVVVATAFAIGFSSAFIVIVYTEAFNSRRNVSVSEASRKDGEINIIYYEKIKPVDQESHK